MTRKLSYIIEAQRTAVPLTVNRQLSYALSYTSLSGLLLSVVAFVW